MKNIVEGLASRLYPHRRPTINFCGQPEYVQSNKYFKGRFCLCKVKQSVEYLSS